MSLHTRVPELVDVLLERIGAQPEVEPRALVDGARTVKDYADYIIFVGFRPDSEQWISVERIAPQGLRAHDTETVTLGVLIAVCNTDDDMAAARRRAGEKLAAVERVLTEDMTLGMGRGVRATIASAAWMPLHTTKGAECNVSVDVRVEVLL